MAEMSLNPAAIESYKAAADEVSGLFNTAGTHVQAAAGADLTDLGLIGADFAAVWATTLGGHVTELGTAGELVNTFGQVLTTHAAAVITVDEDAAAAQRALQAGLE